MATYISIHAPRKGERRGHTATIELFGTFQSTLPARGSDCPKNWINLWGWVFQSTLPARGSDSGRKAFERITGEFQSTLPARGSDYDRTRAGVGSHYFNPRSPQGGATWPGWDNVKQLRISIHAPRKGERHGTHIHNVPRLYFNPRSPQGGATYRFAQNAAKSIFQSTLPARGSDTKE